MTDFVARDVRDGKPRPVDPHATGALLSMAHNAAGDNAVKATARQD